VARRRGRRSARAPGPTSRSRPRRPGRAPHVTKSRYAFRAGPGNTWLEVREGSATGKVLYAHVLSAGRHIRVDGRKLWVTVGAPWNLSVKANGHPLEVPSKVKGHLLVTRSDVRAVA